MFQVYNLSLMIRQKILIDIPNLSIKPSAFTALIGPNGAGKTTLLNLLAGDLAATTGNISLDGRLLEDYTVDELAVKRSVLPQSDHIPFAVKARAIILMGILPHHIAFNHPQVLMLLAEVSEILELDHLLERAYQTLSGGEQHRVQIGRVLMQTLFSLEGDSHLEQKVMLLDEPFNHLDLYHQQQLLRYFKSLTQQGLTIVCVMHDINHALQIADELVLLKNGILQGCHPPKELWYSKKLDHIFDINFITLQHPKDAGFSTLSFKI